MASQLLPTIVERTGAEDAWYSTFEQVMAWYLEAADVDVDSHRNALHRNLDVCFFHPFEDGNARAARLARDHVLTRAGLGLHAVEPLFVVSRAAGDERGAWWLAYVVEYFMGPVA